MARWIAGIVAAGTALGGIGRLSDSWPHAPRLVFALGAPWVVTAFVLGLFACSRRRGVAAGASALVTSVIVYYVVMIVLERRVGPIYGLAMVLGWGGIATVTGAVFGLAGATVRHGSEPTRALGAAVAGGALAGEALLFLLRGETGTAALLLTGQAAIGLAAAALLAGSRRRVQAIASTASLAMVALVAEAVLRAVMRGYGWGGY